MSVVNVKHFRTLISYRTLQEIMNENYTVILERWDNKLLLQYRARRSFNFFAVFMQYDGIYGDDDWNLFDCSCDSLQSKAKVKISGNVDKFVTMMEESKGTWFTLGDRWRSRNLLTAFDNLIDVAAYRLSKSGFYTKACRS